MTYSRPPAASGLGTAKVDIPVSCQSSLPLTSYDRTPPVAAVTISVRRSFFQTSGVVQLLVSLRSTAPDLRARPLVVGGDERLLLVVVDDVDARVVHDGRRRMAEPGLHLESVHRPGPERLPVHVEREQPDVAEVHVHPLTVGDRGLGGVAVLQVPRFRRHAGVGHAFPANPPGLQVDVIQDPAMRGRWLRRRP